MTKRARAMTQQDLRIRLLFTRLGDFLCHPLQHIQSRGMGLVFNRNEGATEL
jgi:hypothetical protein